MHLSKLALINFKNYPQAELLFSSGVNCFVGHNGAGKTNLLDAIHYLSMCKSYFNAIDSLNIQHGKDFFIIQGIFHKNDAEDNVYCGFKKNEKKQFKLNQKEYSKLASHIGLFPVVMISPLDSTLVTEGSEERRKLVDSIISQYDKPYLEDLISYNKALLQRNALLKHFAQQHKFDRHALEIWDTQMVELGTRIHEKRKIFIAEYIPIVTHYYSFISGGKEDVSVNYISQLNSTPFADLMIKALDKDRAVQYTTQGIHKDDLIFNIGNYPVKKFGSQGQQKSFLTALKLAQFDFIRKVTGLLPILLLDDIFDKLDNERTGKLMTLVSKHNFGQIFITDTHPARIREIFEGIGEEIRLFRVENGAVTTLEHEKVQ